MNRSIYQIKQAWSGLSAKKGFLATVVATLGITLGALLCILTLAYVVIGKPLPYPEQERLYKANATLIDAKGEEVMTAYTYPSIVHLFDNQTLLTQSAMIDYGSGEAVLTSLPSQPTVKATFVTPKWFPLIGSQMALGRYFEETEAKDSFNPVAVLSFDTWKNRFNQDNSILEQSVTFNGIRFRVVGVMAESFIEPTLDGIGEKTDVFLPWDYNTASEVMRRQWGMISDARHLVGKIDSSLNISQMEQTLTTLVNSTWQEKVAGDAFFNGWSYKVELQSFENAILGDSKDTVLLLLAGVIGLVLVACTNITNLFMSRTAEQQRSLAIQAALGASKRHLFQSLLAQSGLIVFMSVIVGLIIASVGFSVLQQYLSMRLPRVDELSINAVTLSSALIIALLLALFFARLSSNMINYRALNTSLQSSGKGTGIQVSKNVRRLLIVSQVTIATLLVFVNIGLLKDSMKVINQPLGYETDNIFNITLSINSNADLSREQRKQLLVEMKSKFLALPQVEDIGQSASPLFDGRVSGQEIEATGESLVVSNKPVDSQYFTMINQPLIEGDFFSRADVTDGNNLIIINDVYAEKLKENGEVLGSKIILGQTPYTVSGVVKGVMVPTDTDIPMRSYPVTRGLELRFLIKLKPQQVLSRELAASTVQETSSQLTLVRMISLNDQQTEILFTQYTTAITSAILAVLTFFLASLGLYGVLNYATQMRRFELGIRLAIGAKRNTVFRLILKDNAGAIAIGFVISLVILLAMSIGFSEVLASYINAQLISVFIITLILIASMALFACYWPLRSIINVPVIRSLRGAE